MKSYHTKWPQNSLLFSIWGLLLPSLGCALHPQLPRQRNAPNKQKPGPLMERAGSEPEEAIGRRGFGGFCKHYWAGSMPRKPHNDLVWTDRWTNPRDLRHRTPSQARNFVTSPPPVDKVPSYWVQVAEAPIQSFSRSAEEKEVYWSFPATRHEKWSTLRQHIPSAGYAKGSQPYKWHVSKDPTLPKSISKPRRYGKVNSLMTK